ncbi:MAG: hypothetical protein Q9191_004264 [Dirinaria sp. TL-2023a]
MYFSYIATATVAVVGSLFASRHENIAAQRHQVAQTGDFQPRWGLKCDSVADYIDGFASAECGPFKYDPKPDQHLFAVNHPAPVQEVLSVVDTKAKDDDEDEDSKGSLLGLLPYSSPGCNCVLDSTVGGGNDDNDGFFAGFPLSPWVGYAFMTVLGLEVALAIFVACGFILLIAWWVCSQAAGFVKRLFIASSTLSPAQRVARLHNKVLRAGRVEDDGQLRYSLDSIVQFDQNITTNKNNLETELRTRITQHDQELRDRDTELKDRDTKLSTADDKYQQLLTETDNKYKQLEQQKRDEAKQFAEDKSEWSAVRTDLEKQLAIGDDTVNLLNDFREQDSKARKEIERKAAMYKDWYEDRRVRVKYFRDLNGMLAQDLATAKAQAPRIDTAKVDELTAQLTELRAQHEDVLLTQGWNLSGANIQIGQLSREAAQLREQLTAKNGECGKLEQQLKTKTGENAKLEEQLSTKTGEYKKLEDIQSELGKRRSQLQARLKTSYSERNKTDREVKRVNLEHDKLKGESQALKAQLECAQQEIALSRMRHTQAVQGIQAEQRLRARIIRSANTRTRALRSKFERKLRQQRELLRKRSNTEGQKPKEPEPEAESGGNGDDSPPPGPAPGPSNPVPAPEDLPGPWEFLGETPRSPGGGLDFSSTFPPMSPIGSIHSLSSMPPPSMPEFGFLGNEPSGSSSDPAAPTSAPGLPPQDSAPTKETESSIDPAALALPEPTLEEIQSLSMDPAVIALPEPTPEEAESLSTDPATIALPEPTPEEAESLSTDPATIALPEPTPEEAESLSTEPAVIALPEPTPEETKSLVTEPAVTALPEPTSQEAESLTTDPAAIPMPDSKPDETECLMNDSTKTSPPLPTAAETVAETAAETKSPSTLPSNTEQEQQPHGQPHEDTEMADNDSLFGGSDMDIDDVHEGNDDASMEDPSRSDEDEDMPPAPPADEHGSEDTDMAPAPPMEDPPAAPQPIVAAPQNWRPSPVPQPVTALRQNWRPSPVPQPLAAAPSSSVMDFYRNRYTAPSEPLPVNPANESRAITGNAPRATGGRAPIYDPLGRGAMPVPATAPATPSILSSSGTRPSAVYDPLSMSPNRPAPVAGPTPIPRLTPSPQGSGPSGGASLASLTSPAPSTPMPQPRSNIPGLFLNDHFPAPGFRSSPTPAPAPASRAESSEEGVSSQLPAGRKVREIKRIKTSSCQPENRRAPQGAPGKVQTTSGSSILAQAASAASAFPTNYSFSFGGPSTQPSVSSTAPASTGSIFSFGAQQPGGEAKEPEKSLKQRQEGLHQAEAEYKVALRSKDELTIAEARFKMSEARLALAKCGRNQMIRLKTQAEVAEDRLKLAKVRGDEIAIEAAEIWSKEAKLKETTYRMNLKDLAAREEASRMN